MTDYTYCFGDSPDAFVLNTDFNNTFPFVDITDVAGLDSAPQRTNTDEHEGADGTYVDSQYLSSRTIVLTGDVYTNPMDSDTLLNILKRQYAGWQGVKPFYFQTPGQSIKFLNCLGGGLKYDHDTNRSNGKTSGVQFTLYAGDPYIYDYPSQQVSITVPTIANVGMHFNAAFNLGFGGSITGNQATLQNNGSHIAYPLITLAGPLVNPSLVDSVNGVTQNFSISLSAADQLVIDCKNKSVVLNGQVSRRSSMQGIQWFSVPSMGSETIQFFADSGTGGASFQMSNTYF
jgi:hypothetical protein